MQKLLNKAKNQLGKPTVVISVKIYVYGSHIDGINGKYTYSSGTQKTKFSSLQDKSCLTKCQGCELCSLTKNRKHN